MIWHPLTWAFWAATITGALLYGAGALGAMDVALNWAPANADIDQLRREQRAETTALLGHWSLGCLAAAAGLGVVGIALVWQHVVPGAMCGTGVLQAMGTHGGRAMVFWSAALMTLYAWRVLERLDSHHPQGVMTPACARVMIAALPLLALALYYSWQALMRVDSADPVSCCAAVYDQVLDGPSTSAAWRWLTPLFVHAGWAGGATLLALALLRIRIPQSGSGALLTGIAFFWSVAATVAVKQVWSAYYYQVLSHPCPWCLFLPDHGGAGFFIFGCMAVALAESIALGLADRTRRRFPLLAEPALRRIRVAAWRIALALLGFTLLTTGPAIAWRLHTGVWLDGGS